MAATDVEVVNFIRVRVDTLGNPYTADTKNRSIAQNLSFTDEFRIQPDPDVPESAGYPTLKTYLKAMANRATPLYPRMISQTMVVVSK
jgi:hypothetical protein